MEDIVRWDWLTLVIYLLLIIFCGILFKKALICKKNNKVFKLFKRSFNCKCIYYLIILIVLVLFMCTRVITSNLGGADTLRYIYFFENFNYTKFVLKDILTMHGWEYLFFNFMYFIRIIGGNYRLFMYIIYTILIIGYIYYFDQNVEDENEWFVSLFFLIPYLKSMNIIRNCLAASIGLFSLEMLKKNKPILFILFFILAYLTHYISVVLLVFALFYYYFPNKYYDSRKKIIKISLSSFIITLVGIPIIEKMLLMTRYAGYINRIEFSPWGYLIYAGIYLLILIQYDDFIKIVKSRNHILFYKMIVFLSIVVPPFTVVNGTQRLLLYFELPRFIMYGDLYKVYENKIPDSKKKLFRIGVIAIVILWVAFRIWRMYTASKVMPYRNIYF